MPTPQFKGSFPVKIREETRYFDKGKIEYIVTNVYRADNVTTGTVGGTLSYAGKLFALTNISISQKNALAEVTHTYTAGDSSAPEVYEVVASVSEEPIASHPAFTAGGFGIYSTSIVSAAGGAVTSGSTTAATGGGAVFDESGGFLRFNNNATNNFFGVQSFLSPQVSYRRIYSAGSAPSAGLTQAVGTIFSSPAGDPPVIPSGRNWILASVNWKNNGNQKNAVGQYEITEEYKSSGPKGWNNAIYYTSN